MPLTDAGLNSGIAYGRNAPWPQDSSRCFYSPIGGNDED